MWPNSCTFNHFTATFSSVVLSSPREQISVCLCLMYEGCFKCSASCFMMLARDVRGRWWWYGSRGWTFLPIFRYILVLWDRWQKRDSLTTWHLTWKCVWSKGAEKKWHLLTFIDACWMFMETKQWITSSGADIYERGMQALVYCWWKCIANGGNYVEESCYGAENLFYWIVLLCSLYLL